MRINENVFVAEPRIFVVLRYKDKIPAMASCAKCHRKFFTPNTYYNDAVGAQEYLLDKFDRHNCNGAPEREAHRW